MLVLDSGGYEQSDEFESGEVGRGPREARPFDRDQYEKIVDRLPKGRDLLVVTYDAPTRKRDDYSHQIADAQEFAAERPHLNIDFLLKPAGTGRFIHPKDLVPVADQLRQFAVVGVTEKELGDTLLERLLCLAQLRETLDDAGADEIPIHVFGGLDPILTTLYFMVGAEVFDGLSWLRYAYHQGMCIHQDELAVLTGAIEYRAPRRDALRHVSNIQYLKTLKNELERWASEPDRYELLGPHHEKLREIVDTVKARLRRRS